ncbi:NlpC/P60 family protein [Methylobacterium sp. Leaf93]|uniref:NlpC/P60 family protein n=1 Tax=Methylobacterium sp. Leaf93 TaxID=1736249 RepID=UPI0006F205C6|nr:NlpC/P60 family protein [Methylobacterium sp. Leaf93]KQP12999.1 peptidase P60 [Methylobacterium sp. Leaf93]
MASSDRIVAEARAWIGTPYRHQASLKGIGCDCLGLVRGIWREFLGPEPETAPPYSASWAESALSGTDPMAEAARRHLVAVRDPLNGYTPAPGDVLLFAFRAHLPAKHCAITSGDGTMIHAHDGAAVTEVALTRWWRRHLAHVFRFPDAFPSPKLRPPC